MKDGDAHQYACDNRNPYQLVDLPVVAVESQRESHQVAITQHKDIEREIDDVWCG